MGVEPIRSVLVAEGLAVEIHDDHFKRDEEDSVWLTTAGQQGWVVFTKDQRLRYRHLRSRRSGPAARVSSSSWPETCEARKLRLSSSQPFRPST
ncbi:MAG: hypothetical protein HYZ57_21270 [Acidobacteria bacterium]|nr:hypothetical protein [Acidobacteriota bacterium]